MFKKWRKQLKCEHEFTKVGELAIDTHDKWSGHMTTRYTVIYCPICGIENHVRKEKYEIELAKQRARQVYQRKNLRDS